MYLSFIEEEKEKLAKRLDALEELEETLENKCDDIISELRMNMNEAISEVIFDAFNYAGIEDNYYGEKTDEAATAMQEYVESNF